jgi:hypothetical protein
MIMIRYYDYCLNHHHGRACLSIHILPQLTPHVIANTSQEEPCEHVTVLTHVAEDPQLNRHQFNVYLHPNGKEINRYT